MEDERQSRTWHTVDDRPRTGADTQAFQALRPVREMGALQGVAFGGCTVADGDLSPLGDLAPGVIVVPPSR